MDASLLEDFRKLEQEKEKLELELQNLHDFLNQDGMPGISGSLIDEEGFPRADLDIYGIRKARNRYACAQTDHVEVMKKIEQALANIHAGSRVEVPRAAPAGYAAPSQKEESAASDRRLPGTVVMAPFALIDEVTDGSPAHTAGLHVGDLVCQFGPVSLQDTGDLNACFRAVGQLVPKSAGMPISVIVQRGEPPARVELQLTPQQWAGRGLLGCHMAPKT
eukprot:TRINITY_DN36453_c0_g1_i1.p1 TRINITY_DN36453_c0_g1~~TRINITY_DN36453_c0_g1_i1.p1  ORF type:complete len:245 (-),score=43.07 TRINITY_DN36453_c0_g1_i1:79-738(-)